MDYTSIIGRHVARNMGRRATTCDADFRRLGTAKFPPRVWKEAAVLFDRRD
jgi:hypothetical protein